MNRSGSGAKLIARCGVPDPLHSTLPGFFRLFSQPSIHCLEDIPPPAVIGSDSQRQALYISGSLLLRTTRINSCRSRIESREIAHDSQADAIARELGRPRCFKARTNNCMSRPTSSVGRRQFSELKAKRVRYSMRRSRQSGRASRTVSTRAGMAGKSGRKRFSPSARCRP
jgi:hypothetical protein